MIKQILFATVIALACSFNSQSQGLFAPHSQKDKISKSDVQGTPITFEKVIELTDSVSKDILFSRAMRWYAQSFKSAEAVIEMEDRPGGQIIGNGNFRNILKTALASVEDKITFTVETYLKNGRARIILREFKSDQFLIVTDAPAFTVKGISKKSQNRLWRETQDAVKENSELILKSFEKAIATPTDGWRP